MRVNYISNNSTPIFSDSSAEPCGNLNLNLNQSLMPLNPEQVNSSILKSVSSQFIKTAFESRILADCFWNRYILPAIEIAKRISKTICSLFIFSSNIYYMPFALYVKGVINGC